MLIITGSIAYDYIMDFPGLFSDHILPEKLHSLNLSFVVNKFNKRRGGTAGNASYTLALLNTPHILFSAVGKDFDEYKKYFVQMNINVSHVKTYNDTYTATGFAMTDKNENQFWGYYYGAVDYSDKLKLKTVTKKDDLVLIGPQGAKGSLSFVKQCIYLKLNYMFDPGFILTQVNNSDLKAGIANAAYIIGNEYEISLMKNRITDFDSLTKTKITITTLGAQGAVINANGNKFLIKPVHPNSIIDPTGAGDAWRSGFLSGIERGFDLQTSGQMGAVAASYVLENIGTQEHTFTKKQFAKRYKDTYNESLQL